MTRVTSKEKKIVFRNSIHCLYDFSSVFVFVNSHTMYVNFFKNNIAAKLSFSLALKYIYRRRSYFFERKIQRYKKISDILGFLTLLLVCNKYLLKTSISCFYFPVVLRKLGKYLRLQWNDFYQGTKRDRYD